MRIVPLVLVFGLAAACSSPEEAETPATNNPTTPPEVDAGVTVEPTCVPGRTCLSQGDNTFESGSDTRDVTVLLPAQPSGAPGVFAWHYLNGSRQELIACMQLQQLADAGYHVVVPASRDLAET